ncbi:MAG: PTS sugar transporter subunit IIA [Erysipelotrichaceae bacterium]|nr:PTS sugar transporter subunit IIA [Erysipelotrichaceae bacterium]
MIGLVICTHSNMAGGLKDAVEMIAGVNDHLCALGFYGDEQLTEYGDRIKAAVEGFPEGAVIITDMLNATPYNAALYAIAHTKHVVVTGASLPLVLELLIKAQYTAADPETLASEVLAAKTEYSRLTCSRDIFNY